jgi:hypothetical protein
MNHVKLQHGRWEVECLPADGARLSVLRFAGRDLFTRPPTHFQPPTQDLGRYETRPVYGYDDCFPSVEPCALPGREGIRVPDHGELCWLRWEVGAEENRLDCRVRSVMLPAVRFRRSLIFRDATVTWEFEVFNGGSAAIPFLHVMHALMPLDHVIDLRFPRFAHVIDEASGRALALKTPRQCADYVLGRPRGTATMLLLRSLEDGRVEAAFEGGMVLAIEFSSELFPTLGIWWNNGGYPDEDGCRRVECALEPIPGTTSSLAQSYAEQVYLTVPPTARISWQVVWNIKVT